MRKIINVLMLSIVLGISFYLVYDTKYSATESKDNIQKTEWDNLNSKEIIRLKEIIIEVMRNKDASINSLKKEYWNILDRVYGNNREKATHFMLGKVSQKQFYYGKYFWMDAMMSYTQGRVYLSNELLVMEEEMIKSGVITQSKIDNNHNMLKKIALKQKIVIDGQEVIFNADAIQASIDNSDGAIKRFRTIIYY